MAIVGLAFLFYLDRFGESYIGEMKDHSFLQWTISERQDNSRPSYKFSTVLEDIAEDQQKCLGSGGWQDVPLDLEVKKNGRVIVLGDGEFLGYLPKTTGTTVAKLINDGVEVRCMIESANYHEGVLNVVIVLKWK